MIMRADHSFPTLPTIEVVQQWIKEEMKLLGLEWDSTKAHLDPIVMMKEMIANTESGDIDGKYHFQILADGVSCYRHVSVCNVGLKMFNASPNFNSLTSLKML